MPKAKTKTKGVLNTVLVAGLTRVPDDILHEAPDITIGQSPTTAETPMEAATQNGMSSAVRKLKLKRSGVIDCQLKKKRSKREYTSRTRSKRELPTVPSAQTDLRFEDNRIQNSGNATAHVHLSKLSEFPAETVAAETDLSHDLPSKKRRKYGESTLNTRVEYTSMVKRESVLVIRKQISQCDDDDDVPLKMMKHSIDNILCTPCDKTCSTINPADKSEKSIVEPEITAAVALKIEHNENSSPTETSYKKGEDEVNNGLNDCAAMLPFEADFDSDKTEPYDYVALHSPLPPISPLPLTYLPLTSPNIMVNSPLDASSPHPNSPIPKEGSVSPGSFEPIPSTSRDNAAFEKNQEMLQKSVGVDDDCEIIETPVETIDVEDYSPSYTIRHIPCSNTEPIDVDDEEVKFVGYHTIPTFSDIEVRSILSARYTESGNSNDCEIIDVDEVMAHSEKLLKRFKQRNVPSSVIVQTPAVPVQQTIEIDDSFQLRDMDTANIDDASTWEDLCNVLEPGHIPESTPSSDPVMASVTSQQSRTNLHPGSVSSIVDKYFHNNPVPTTSNLVPTTKKSTISNIGSTLGNILDAIAGNFRTYDASTNLTGSSRLPQTAAYDLTTASDPVEVVGTSRMFDPYQRNYDLATSDALPYYVPSYCPQGPAIRSLSFVNAVTSAVSMASMSSVPPAQTRTSPSSKSPDSKDTGTGGVRSMECPICMELLFSRQPASTICGHLFCWGCIEKAVNAPGGRRCPTCRKPFSKKGQSYHKIYL